MKRYFGFIILLFGLSCAATYGKNETENDQVNVEDVRNFAPDHLTVEPEIGTSEIMTDSRGQDEEVGQGRTFAIRRLQFMLLPIMYKLGVATTLLVLLVFLALKAVMIGTVILVLKVGSFLAKFHQPYHHIETSHHEPSWSPPPHSWPQPQPFHVHMHHDYEHDTHDPHDPHDSHDPHDHHDLHDLHDRRDQQIHDLVYSGWDNLAASNPYGKLVAIDSRGQYILKG